MICVVWLKSPFLVHLVEFAVASQPFLIQIDIGHKATLIHAIDAIGNFHLINATDLVKHHFAVRDVVFLQ